MATHEGGSIKYHYNDHLSLRVMSDSVGANRTEQAHFPFGEQWYNSTGSKLLFTSYERDSESGNDYAVFRYDLPRLGRFGSPDPVAGTVGVPQSLNRYAYALNAPVDLVDPLGLSPDRDCSDAAGVGCHPLMEGGCALNCWFGPNSLSAPCVYCGFSMEMLLGHALVNQLVGMGATQAGAEEVARHWTNFYFYGGDSTVMLRGAITAEFAGMFRGVPPVSQNGQILVGQRLLKHWATQIGCMQSCYHSYIGIADGNGGWIYYEVLGGLNGQQVVRSRDDSRHAQFMNATWDRNTVLNVSPAQMTALVNQLNHFASGNACPSCGSNYSLMTYNSNTFVYNMLSQNPAGSITPPGAPLFTPGYHQACGVWYPGSPGC